MLLRTPCILRIARATPHRTQWRRIPMRCYSSAGSDDPPWFQQLRTEMLQRDTIHLPEHITAPTEHKLTRTIYGVLPPECCHSPGFRSPVLPVGHHLIWFNPASPTQELLPDGTDTSHSPGGAWVRRMWAGGSISLKPDDYYDKTRGLTLDAVMAGAERIKDVQLRGQDDAAKIFVTIERRFAHLEKLKEGYREAHGSLGRGTGVVRGQIYFEEQMRQDEGWGDAILREERILVFMKERTAAEREAIKAGDMAAVKYLDPPGKPHFSHTLTPNRALLFRFSALTFNAHLIHLDRDYARNVEGHRNLLVHGPLSLMLMLKAISYYVTDHTEGRQVVESIEYRNLAPLYCDEEMRICGLEKKTLQHGSIYDVWIEGPTGGVAVKGTVYTTVKSIAPTPTPTPTFKARGIGADKSNKGKQAERAGNYEAQNPGYRRFHISTTGSEPATSASLPDNPFASELDAASKEFEQSTRPSAPFPTRSGPPAGEKPKTPIPQDLVPEPPSSEITPPPIQRKHRRIRQTRITSHRFITTPPPSVRRVATTSPANIAVIAVSRLSRNILRRLDRSTPTELLIEPIPLLRTHGATPYTPDPDRTAARHSRYKREGARVIEKPRIRRKGESLEPVGRTRRERKGEGVFWSQG